MTPINGSAVAADIAVGDLDGKGRPTILIATRSWKLYAFHPDGRVRWEGFCYYHPGTKVGILSGPKQPTVIAAGNVYHTPLNVVSPADGSVLWHTWEQCGGEAYSTTDYSGFFLTGMVFLDTDGDGIKEIIFGTKFNRIYALAAADGATKWTAVLDDEVTVIDTMTDPATGEEFILAGTDAGEVVKLNRRGRRVRTLTLSGGITGLQVGELSGTEEKRYRRLDPGRRRRRLRPGFRDSRRRRSRPGARGPGPCGRTGRSQPVLCRVRPLRNPARLQAVFPQEIPGALTAEQGNRHDSSRNYQSHL